MGPNPGKEDAIMNRHIRSRLTGLALAGLVTLSVVGCTAKAAAPSLPRMPVTTAPDGTATPIPKRPDLIQARRPATCWTCSRLPVGFKVARFMLIVW